MPRIYKSELKELSLKYTKEVLLESYSRLGSYTKVAKELGIYQQRISQLCKLVGIEDANEFRVRVSTILTNKILQQLYIGQQMSTIEIAEKLKVHPSSVNKYLKKYNIPRRGQADAQRVYNKFPIERIAIPTKAEDAYLIGLVATDGCIYHDKRHGGGSCKLIITLVESDKHILEDLLKEFNLTNTLKYRGPVTRNFKTGSYRCKGQFCLTIQDPGFITAFSKWGIGPHKSKTVGAALNLPKDLWPAYIHGVFDGDGTLSKDHIAVSMVSASKKFVLGIQRMLKELGISSVIAERDDHLGIYNLRILLHQMEKFIQLVYCSQPFGLKRKQVRAFSILDRLKNQVNLKYRSLVYLKKNYSNKTSFYKIVYIAPEKIKCLSTEDYHGVEIKDGRFYTGRFSYIGRRIYLGTFKTELEAAQAVDRKCIELGIPQKNNTIK